MTFSKSRTSLSQPSISPIAFSFFEDFELPSVTGEVILSFVNSIEKPERRIECLWMTVL